MQDRIIEFANVLRRNGLRVSLSENVDAFRALELLGIEHPALFRVALRSTLVKRTVDLKPFEDLFDFFFYGIGRSLNDAEQQLIEQLNISPQEFQQLLERLQKIMREMEGELSELTRAVLSGDAGKLEQMLREAAAHEADRGSGESF